MTVAELIEALSRLPQGAPVVVLDVLSDEPVTTAYAKVAEACVRYSIDTPHMNSDLTITVEPWGEAQTVILLKSVVFEADEFRAGHARALGVTVYEPMAHHHIGDPA